MGLLLKTEVRRHKKTYLSIDKAALAALTERERTICVLYRSGKSIDQIADELGLAPRMVISYMAGNIASKLGLPNRKAVEQYLRPQDRVS